jgi:hypothetical protein
LLVRKRATIAHAGIALAEGFFVMSRNEADKNSPVRAIPLVLMVALVACASIDDVEEGVATVEQYGQSSQGQSSQGQSSQGQSSQSSGVEAVSVLNVKKNGVTLSAVKVLNGELRATGVSGAGMVGARLKGTRGTGAVVELSLDGYAIDVSKPMISSDFPAHTNNSDVHLYKFTYKATDGSWKPLCTKRFVTDASGASVEAPDSEMAVVLPGVWVIDNGQWLYSSSEFTIGCWRGTIAKCVRWGYKPWKTMTTTDGVSVKLDKLHLACVRGAMADYCGNGESATINGTLVDVFDRYGFIKKSNEWNVFPNMFSEESSFDPDGAGCVERARWESIGAYCEPTYEIIEPDYTTGNYWDTKPRFRQIPTFRSGERSSCAGASQLVLFDTSTYCHDPKTTSIAMPADCSSCTTNVCSVYPKCCDTTTTDGNSVGTWTPDCQNYAKTLKSCSAPIIFGGFGTL